jgi:ribonuclease P protein component
LRFSFKKEDRIRKRSDFLELSSTGHRIQDRFFIIVFSANPFERSRLGVTVTKKVGPAVKRNRLKRVIREFFRLNRHNLEGHWDINIIAKKEAVDLSSKLVNQSLQQMFVQISEHVNH